VVIDQAVEVAKRFCSDEAGSLVNGVLGSVAASVGASRDSGAQFKSKRGARHD
jgi:transcription termination factor NusB